MNDRTMSRRDLNRLLAAAMGGLVTGVHAGCSENPAGQGTPPSGSAPSAADSSGTKAAGTENDLPRLLQDPHVCRGINTCKNKGKPGTKNACAGQAHCATVAAHDCNGMNDCKGQGGCGEHPGENECSGKGSCAVPLSDKTWPKARMRFEELMTKADKKFSDAPAKEG
jgi:hypothetical protein